MKNLLCAILILAFPAVYYGQAKKTAGPLDGKIFVIDLFKEGKKKALDSDEIKFTAGKFKSIYFADWGFTKASLYQVASADSSTANKVINWTTECVNDIKETLTWTATITGEEIEGTAILVDKKGKSRQNYTFTGKLKQKPRKK